MAMSPGNQVSFYNSQQSGAPSLTGVAGSLIAVLDAVLVNGWGSQTATSVVVASAVATMTLPSTPAMTVGGLVQLAGATPAGLNGDHKVLSVSGNVVTFDATGVSNGTATGTITAKISPLGWSKVFTGTNLAAYKSGAAAATQCLLRVDDTAAQVGRVFGYETMSDVNTGTGQFPTSVQQSGGLYWAKSSTADATAKQWSIIGDDRLFYFMPAPVNTVSLTITTNGANSHMFGDVAPLNSADAFACCLFGWSSATPYSASSADASEVGVPFAPTTTLTQQNGKYIARAYTQTGASIACGMIVKGVQSAQTTASGAASNVIPFPNPINNGLLFGRQSVYEPAGVRAEAPGIIYCPQNLGSPTVPYSNKDIFAGTGGLASKKIIVLKTSGAATAGTIAVSFFDLTGPWR